MNRIDRLMAIVLLLQNNRTITAEKIAQHFEMSVRTVYRDINALAEVGVPIISEAGVGYSLMSGYYLPPVSFTEPEANALITGGVLVEKMTDETMGKDIKSALLKIKSVLSDDQKEKATRLTATTTLLKSNRAQDDSHIRLSQIQQSLTDCRVVSIRYNAAGKGDITEREIEPVGLIHYLDHWHLMAWCLLRNDYRDFRVDRIESYEITDRTFLPRDLSNFDNLLCDWQHDEPPQYARVEFSYRVIERAMREWTFGEVIKEDTPNGAILQLETHRLEWLANWLLSFRTEARVIEPPELASIVIEKAQQMIEHHQKFF